MREFNRLSAIVVASAAVVALAGCNLQAPVDVVATATPFIFPTATEPVQLGAVAGRVWNDACDPVGDGEAPLGCVATDDVVMADGVLAPDETGLAGVAVRLGEGACPAFGLATATTDSAGSYRFSDLPPGTYCVSVDSTTEENPTVLGSGLWTFPATEAGVGTGQQSVTLNADGAVDGVNFGWDPQQTPPPTETPDPTATEPVGATITPVPTGTVNPTDPKSGLGAPTFEDMFETAENWPLYSNEQVIFQLGEGELEMQALKADFSDWWVLSWPNAADFYLEAEGGLANCAGRDELGLVFRSTNDAGNWVGYLFALTCDGRYALRSWDGEAFTHLIPLTASSLISAGPNQSHRLGVLAEGTTISLYVNGEKLTEVTDDLHEDGIFGVFIGAGTTPGVRGAFQSMQFWDLD